mmetsp:Transcript_71990/g.154002  ORF Transcript_71990/g.154002 Transcript_71990/m.154002 type:complete len:109 (-) Transcript_71990:222-548(-)
MFRTLAFVACFLYCSSAALDLVCSEGDLDCLSTMQEEENDLSFLQLNLEILKDVSPESLDTVESAKPVHDRSASFRILTEEPAEGELADKAVRVNEYSSSDDTVTQQS